MSRSAKVALAALLVLIVGNVLFWTRDTLAALAAFPGMPSAYEAKEMCSCLWVEGRDDAFCDAFVHQDVVPTQGREVDTEARRVTARALWRNNSARWTSDRTGCVLE